MLKRLLPLALMLALAVSVTAQENASEPAVNQTALDDVLDSIGGAVETVGDAVEATGEGIKDAATGTARFFGKALTAVGEGLAASFDALAGASTFVSAGLAAAALATLKGLATGIGAVGEAFTAALAWTGTIVATATAAIGRGIAFLAGAYWGLVSQLRPEAMPAVAFVGAASVGGAATTGVGGWAGWNVLRKWGMLGAGLGAPIAGFSRIDDADLLEHPVRQQIFGTIQAHPGIHASQLARDVGVGWGTVSHHLDKLTRANLVATRKVNNQKCFFEQGGSVSRQDMEAASAVKGDTAGRIAGFVHNHPMSSQKELSESLGISAALASFHVKKLVNLGVLDRMRHGKETLLTTSSNLRRLVAADRSVAVAMQGRADEGLQYSA